MDVTGAACKLAYHFIAKHLPTSSAPWACGSRRIRVGLVRHFTRDVHVTANIERGADIGGRDLTVGARSGIGINCMVQVPLHIGADVMMGPECRIYTVAHESSDISRPMLDQGATAPEGVVIHDDVWLGARVMVMPGVTIGHGSIVAAGAVVTKDVAPFTVVAGVPATVVRKRQ